MPPVRNLILMATPIDFDEMGAMVAFLREGRLTAAELVDDTGNVPADVLYSGFYMQAPTTEIAQKATLLENLWNDEFVEGFQAMAQWSRDHVPFPGALFRQLVEEFVRKNVLMTGSIRLGDRKVHLADARGNVLNAMAERDNVVPPAAVEPVMQLVGDPARREELRLPGGHVTFGTGRSAVKHTMPQLAEWIIERSDELSRTEGVVMEFRPIAADDEAALKRFFARIPEADRTFLKEDVDDPEVLAAWARPGTARVDRRRRRRGRRLGRGRPAARLVQPRRRGPPGRGPRARADAASAAGSPARP